MAGGSRWRGYRDCMDQPDSASTLNSSLRRQLAARGNRLRATVVIGRQGLTEAVVAQVRRVLEETDLIKVRAEVGRGAEADVIAGDLARRVPCQVVKRIGKMAVLYQPPCEPAKVIPRA